jgi:glycosyltransferase involved in cell wall biosynthesis
MIKTRIVYTVNDPSFFLSHRLPLAIQALKKNWEVYLISDFSNVDQKLFTDQKIIPVHIPLNKSSVSIRSNLSTFFSLSSKLKELNPNIIHNITLKMSLLGSLTSFLGVRSKIINAISGLGYLYTNSRFSLSKIVVAILFRVINAIYQPFYIFQNKNDLKIFKGYWLKNQFSIIKGSGVNHKEFIYTSPIKSQKVNITFTGRILKDKGILELIKAIEILPKNIQSKVVLNIYGKVDLENPAHINEKEFKKLLKPDSIIWHGNTNDIKNVLIKSDIYCLPSYREGLPKSTIEAMAIGRPIVTTNAPGCEDTASEGVNGYKVDVKDYKTLSEKLKILIEDEPLRIQMGKKSREIFEENFTLAKVIKESFELYESLIVKN